MAKGISVYPGEQKIEDILTYIEIASKLKYSLVFSSIHIPETNTESLLKDFEAIGLVCKKNNMKFMLDISPKTFDYFSFDDFVKFAISNCVTHIRVDFGIDSEKIVFLSKFKAKFKLVINSSTLFLDNFESLIRNGLKIDNIEACYNFYPSRETGISENFFINQCAIFKKYNLPISAFIPSNTGKRGPVCEGLPTIEKHRNMRSSLAFRHLKLMGVDNVIIGDDKASEDELTEISSLNEEATLLECKIFSNDKKNYEILQGIHTERPDSSELVIRSQESRLILSSGHYNKVIIDPENCVKRNLGDITVDNKFYERYAGELRVCRVALPQDDRVNVIGKINDDNVFLIPYIKYGKKFYFKYS